MHPLRLGLSTCPNDTFLFAALLEDRVDRRGLDLEFTLGDVQELNESLRAGELDVSKASFAVALDLAATHGVLPVGSALGFGVGPVLLGRPGGAPVGPEARVLAPGRDTTAALLLKCLHPELERVEHVRFDRIMPALARGEADLGVVIHEGRFTHSDLGLLLVEDLGERWEQETGQPVPLGGLLARQDLGADLHERLTEVLRASLEAARSDPRSALPVMRQHAQEMSEDVIWAHVDLYVNAHTLELGAVGARCLEALAARSGAERGAPPLL